MSFFRHEEIYRSDVSPGYSWERQLNVAAPCSSAAMSFQSAIPWRVALRQSLPPLYRPVTILNNPLCRTIIFQRTATTPLTSCLSPRVHSKKPPSLALHPQTNNNSKTKSNNKTKTKNKIKVVYTEDLTHPGSSVRSVLAARISLPLAAPPIAPGLPFAPRDPPPAPHRPPGSARARCPAS